MIDNSYDKLSIEQQIKSPMVSRKLIFSVITLVVLIAIWSLYSLNVRKNPVSEISETGSVELNKKTPPSIEYIFQTFIRGKVCAYNIGTNPNIISPNCRFWSFDPTNYEIKELGLLHRYIPTIVARQTYEYKISTKKIYIGGCNVLDGKMVCPKAHDEDDLNKYIFTIKPTDASQTSVGVGSLNANETEIIIDNMADIGCQGNISAWSELLGEILFTEAWQGTPQSQSGEMLKSLCVYNYKSGEVIMNRSFPIDKYSHTNLINMKRGLIYFRYDNLFINYKINSEEILELPINFHLVYEESPAYLQLFKNNMLVLLSESSDGTQILLYDVSKKKIVSHVKMPNTQDLEEDLKQKIEIAYVSTDLTHIVFLKTLRRNANERDSDFCFFDWNIQESTAQKIVCSHEFQAMYKYLDPTDPNQYVYVDFLDIYQNEPQEEM